MIMVGEFGGESADPGGFALGAAAALRGGTAGARRLGLWWAQVSG